MPKSTRCPLTTVNNCATIDMDTFIVKHSHISENTYSNLGMKSIIYPHLNITPQRGVFWNAYILHCIAYDSTAYVNY